MRAQKILIFIINLLLLVTQNVPSASSLLAKNEKKHVKKPQTRDYFDLKFLPFRSCPVLCISLSAKPFPRVDHLTLHETYSSPTKIYTNKLVLKVQRPGMN